MTLTKALLRLPNGGEMVRLAILYGRRDRSRWLGGVRARGLTALNITPPDLDESAG